MSRKRSRKSKIVLRECVESDDEIETNLQRNIPRRQRDSKNDNNTPTIENERQQNESPPIQFSVTVDVEKFDVDSNDVISDTNEEPINPTNPVNIPPQTNETQQKKGYVLNRDKIIKTVNKIMEESSNIADQSLGIAVKNSLGHFTKSYLDFFETKIHQVLVKWMDWEKSNKQKITPLMYKCYNCERAWWHLSEFRDHLKVHDTNNELFGLDLEEYTSCESNIIAYYGDEPYFQYFHPEGNCPRCGNNSETHMRSHRKDNAYICSFPGCSLSFPTCSALKTHEYKLHTAEITGNVIKWKKSCVVCNIAFSTQASYDTHMQIMHSIRSDVVVPMTYKKCHFCKRQYLFNYMQHTCIKKGIVDKCEKCYRKFPPGYLYKTHISSTDIFTCKICNVTLPKACMGVQHLMTHTDKFVIVKKCILCKAFKVFLEDEATCKHNHEEYDINSCYDDPIVIPKSCLQNEQSKVKILDKRKKKGLDNRKDKEFDNNQDICVKVEPEDFDSDIFVKREIEIKHEIIDESNTGNDDSSVIIKEEIQDEDYSIDIEENLIPNIFGVKIDPDEIIIKDEIEDESDYEDDIIRLNPDLYLNQDETVDIQDDFEDEIEETVPRKKRKSVNKVPKLYSCLKCGFEGFHKDYREHLRNNCLEGDAPGNYTCSKCDLTFTTFKRYLLHFTDHGLMPMACPVCFKILEKIPELISHVFVHVRMRFSSQQIVGPDKMTKIRHKCKVCFAEIDKTEFFEHWESHLELVDTNSEEIHDEIEMNEDFMDSYDDSKLLKQSVIQKILQCLQSREYTTKNKPGCIICHRHFHRRNDCKRHLIEHLLSDALRQQTLESGLKCPICDARFEKPHYYKQHMRDHAGLPVYKCELCSKRFSDSSNYAKHKKIHNINAYTCDTCGRKFNAKTSIEKHMEIHKFQKPITCALCGKIFNLTTLYKKHLRLYHCKKVGHYGCQMCPRKFDSTKLKWEHMWNVHKERRYKADCSICQRKFRRNIDLKMHLKSDHAISPYRNQRALKLKKRLDEMLMTPKIVNIASVRETLIVYE